MILKLTAETRYFEFRVYIRVCISRGIGDRTYPNRATWRDLGLQQASFSSCYNLLFIIYIPFSFTARSFVRLAVSRNFLYERTVPFHSVRWFPLYQISFTAVSCHYVSRALCTILAAVTNVITLGMKDRVYAVYSLKNHFKWITSKISLLDSMSVFFLSICAITLVATNRDSRWSRVRAVFWNFLDEFYDFASTYISLRTQDAFLFFFFFFFFNCPRTVSQTEIRVNRKKRAASVLFFHFNLGRSEQREWSFKNYAARAAL